MSRSIRTFEVAIRQDLDPRMLDALSDEAAEAAEEDGALGGNRHYRDLRAGRWDDVAFALQLEADLIDQFCAAADPAAAEAAFCDGRDPDQDRETLWWLDVGVAAAVLALSALGAVPYLSCNGGTFGGGHSGDHPYVKFYLSEASPDLLLQLASNAGVGLESEEGAVRLYARSVLDLRRFAAAALERSKTSEA